MLTKIVGGICFLLGLLIVIYFPSYSGKYQTEAMSKTGVLVGILLIVFGLLALFL